MDATFCMKLLALHKFRAWKCCTRLVGLRMWQEAGMKREEILPYQSCKMVWLVAMASMLPTINLCMFWGSVKVMLEIQIVVSVWKLLSRKLRLSVGTLSQAKSTCINASLVTVITQMGCPGDRHHLPRLPIQFHQVACTRREFLGNLNLVLREKFSAFYLSVFSNTRFGRGLLCWILDFFLLPNHFYFPVKKRFFLNRLASLFIYWISIYGLGCWVSLWKEFFFFFLDNDKRRFFEKID